jgi:arylsulfatase A-like enzyme
MKPILQFLFAALLCLPWTSPASPAKPNILFLFNDDQRADTIAALGNPLIKTPNLDRLAQGGLAFTRAFMQGGFNGATCVPSRAMLLSGRSLFHVDERLLSGETWPAAFGHAGYTTFMSGKWHNGEPSLTRSFQIARSVFSGGMTDPLKAKLSNLENGKLTPPVISPKHACQTFADEAIRFLKEHKGGPFLCYVAFDGPHDPHIVPDDFPVRYDPDTIPLPPNFLPQHPFNNGEMAIRDEKLLPWPRPPAEVRAMIADYYRYISYLDMLIGQVLDALKSSPFADNTVVVFSADSGVARGSHGLIGKQNLYEHSLRVPLIMTGPGIPAGKKTDALCYLFDVLPTLGALAGVPAPTGSEGMDLGSVLREPGKPGRSQMVFAYQKVQRAIRDDRWKLIRYPQINRTQLFDLQNDPFETKDLAIDSSHAGKVKELTTQLEKALTDYGDDCPLTVDKPQPAAWSPGSVAEPKAQAGAAGSNTKNGRKKKAKTGQ